MTTELKTHGDRAEFLVAPAKPAPMSDDERTAAIEKWSTMPPEALLEMVIRQGDAWRMLDDAERAMAVLELRPEIERLERAAAAAADLVPRAEQLVEQARQALAGPDGEVAECARRVADLEARLAAAGEADMAALKALHVEIGAYRETLRDLYSRRVGPADQLAAAQRTLRDAQAAAARATAALDAARAKLADPLKAQRGYARLAHVRRTAAYTVAAAMSGERVDDEDFADARSVLLDLFVGLGFDKQARRAGREAVLRELRGLPPHTVR